MRYWVDNLEQFNENLNDENHINEDSTNLNDHNNVSNHINEDTTNLNDHDNVLNHIIEDTTNLNEHDNVPYTSNIEDVGIDEHLVPHLDIYDPRN